MTSQINPNNIDGTYPVAGVPNNTQGMRDNFTNTRTNFQYAADEITELQSKAVLKAAITGTTLDNNMNDQEIYAVQLRDASYAYSQLTATAGSITIDYSVAPYQQINTSGSISLSFTNWPTSGTAGIVDVIINVTNIAHTVTIPASVSIGLVGLEGVSPGTAGVSNTITFSQTGKYTFEFYTSDGGTTVTIIDQSRSSNVYNNTLTLLAPSVSANAAGALNIIGSSSGTYYPVTNSGGMIHITGNDGASSRITNDAYGTGAIPTYSTRAARGTAAAPTAIQSGDTIARFGFTGWDGTDFGAPGGAGCAIEAVAIDNFTSSAQGTNIKLYTSPASANTKTLSMTVASNVVTFPANVAVGGTGGIYITDGGTIGYNNGSGGTVAQTGNKSTGVTLNKPAGEITMQATSLSAATTVQFTLTNSTIAARDLLILNIVGGVATGAAYNLDANCSAGSAVISVRNITAGSLSEAIVLRYVVIKGSVT